MACMCGDTYCPRCGPAQGNEKCIACGNWSMDGPCKNPESCKKVAEEIYRKEEELYNEIEKMENDEAFANRRMKGKEV